MSCLGVHFALSEKEVKMLKSKESDQERLEYVSEEIEEEYLEGKKSFVAESDKAWDAIHRAFTDGELTYDNGNYPLNHVILGGEAIYYSDDYIMSLKTPTQVKAVSGALTDVSEIIFSRSIPIYMNVISQRKILNTLGPGCRILLNYLRRQQITKDMSYLLLTNKHLKIKFTRHKNRVGDFCDICS